MDKQTVFFLSDHTGITVEKLGHSLLTQFDQLQFHQISVPYINSQSKAEQTRDLINEVHSVGDTKPIVFSSITDNAIRKVIQQSQGIVFDFFDTFIDPLEQALKLSASHNTGKVHSLTNQDQYHLRMDAVNYSLANDDGANIKNYDEADVILIGVSRTGKTPTCLYLALQFGISAANYPLTEEDFQSTRLPIPLKDYRKKLYGLTIDLEQLYRIRQKRRPDSRYASKRQCQKEITVAEELYQIENIPSINTTTVSIEEIATKIVNELGFERGNI